MKRIVALFLVILMAVSAVTLSACGKEPATENLKLGLGIVTTVKGADATAEKNGSAEADVNMAAVLLDKDGKIVAVKLDVAQNTVAFTASGEAIQNASFQTKKELKEAYGMSKIGKTEWYLQASKLEEVLVGKTLTEAKALVAEGGYGVEAVQTAGCTMGVEDLIKAVEKAINNAKESNAKATDTLEIAAVTTQSVANATAEKEGKNDVDTTIAAVVTGADKKVTAVQTDVIQVKFAFDATGAFKTDVTAELKTKEELKEDYGMSKIGKQEWYVQNAAFLSQVVGKTAAEVTALMTEDGKGTEAVQTAGCTIGVEDLVKAIVKAIK